MLTMIYPLERADSRDRGGKDGDVNVKTESKPEKRRYSGKHPVSQHPAKRDK